RENGWYGGGGVCFGTKQTPILISKVGKNPAAGRPAKPRHNLARLDSHREKVLIEAALRDCRGRVAGPSGAAAKLGIPRSTLETKIRTLGIDKHQFKSRHAS